MLAKDLGVTPLKTAWGWPKFSERPYPLPVLHESRPGITWEAPIADGQLTITLQWQPRFKNFQVSLDWPGGQYYAYAAKDRDLAVKALPYFLGAYLGGAEAGTGYYPIAGYNAERERPLSIKP